MTTANLVLKCPNCGSTELRVEATAVLRQEPDGSLELAHFEDLTQWACEAPDDAHCLCNACEHEGKVDTFIPKDGPQEGPGPRVASPPNLIAELRALEAKFRKEADRLDTKFTKITDPRALQGGARCEDAAVIRGFGDVLGYCATSLERR
jgi:hypothetical protein